MEQNKEIDWEERHFRLCLAIIQRTETDVYGHSKELILPAVIAKADKMVKLLKERHVEMYENGEKQV